MFLIAHELNADRLARQRHGKESGVAGYVVRAVMAVAARTFGMDAADLVRRQADQLGDGATQRIDALGMAPDSERTVLEPRHRTGRTDRAVFEIGAAILGRERLRAGRHRLAPVEDDVILRRQLLQHGRHIRLGRQSRRLGPARRRGERLHRRDGLPLPRGDYGEEIAVAQNFHHARHRLDRRAVETVQPRAIARRPDDPGVQHPRQAQILDIAGPAGHLAGDIDPRQRLPDLPIAGGGP